MKKSVVSALALLAISTWAVAQNKQVSNATQQLNEVVVTANKFEQKQNTTGKVVTVIDANTIKKNVGKTLSELLNTQAGVFINGANGNMGTNPDLYFRGSSSNGNVLILIDGVPAGDASRSDNSFDLNAITTNQIERIEILKGAQSTLWGSQAVAGVINIITKKANVDKPFSPQAGVAYGSYRTVNANIGTMGKYQKLQYNVGYNFVNSNGFSAATDTNNTGKFDNDKFTQHNILANLGYEFDKNFSAKARVNYNQSKYGIDAGAYTDDDNYTLSNKKLNTLLEVQYSGKTSKIKFQQTFLRDNALNIDDSTVVWGSTSYSENKNKAKTSITELFGNFKLNQNLSMLSGLQYTASNTYQYSKYVGAWGSVSELGADSTRANNFSAYTSLLLNNLNGFNLEAGARFNLHSQYGNNTTFSFNPSYNIDEFNKVFVNISSAFKAPSLYQLYSKYGNKNLMPETSMGYEVGVQNSSATHSLRLVAFKRDVKNLIGYSSGKYVNRAEQNDYGFEIETLFNLGKYLKWNSNFTYVDGEGVENGVVVKNLWRRPNFMANTSLNINTNIGLNFVTSYRYVGTRAKSGYDGGPALWPAYNTIDVYTGYKINNNFNAFVDLKNITNVKYFDTYGYNNKAFNVMVGLQYSF